MPLFHGETKVPRDSLVCFMLNKFKLLTFKLFQSPVGLMSLLSKGCFALVRIVFSFKLNSTCRHLELELDFVV